MSGDRDLRTAAAYLTDLDAELEERSAAGDLRVPSAARQDMLYQLDHARQLVAALEQRTSNVSCLSGQSGCEVLIDLQRVRTWCSAVEVKIARICGSEGASAAG